MPRSDALRVSMLAAIALAVVAGLTPICGPAGAQEEEGKEEAASEFPEGTSKAEVAGVEVEPAGAGVGREGERILLLGAEMKQELKKKERRRELHIGTSFSEGVARAGSEAAAAKEVMSTVGSEEWLYAEWVRGMSGVDVKTTPLAALRLTQFESKLELACQKTVTAGEPIRLYMRSAGGADSNWRVCLVRPDSTASRWDIERPYVGAVKLETRDITAGRKVLGGQKGKVRVISFDTYPAERGKLRGILVEKPDYTEFQHTFWVRLE